MDNGLEEILEELHSEGYSSITPNKDRHGPEASGEVPLPKRHRRRSQTRWRRLLPQIRSHTPDLDLLPDDLQAIVEKHNWIAWPISRDDNTIKVAITEDGR